MVTRRVIDMETGQLIEDSSLEKPAPELTPEPTPEPTPTPTPEPEPEPEPDPTPSKRRIRSRGRRVSTPPTALVRKSKPKPSPKPKTKPVLKKATFVKMVCLRPDRTNVRGSVSGLHYTFKDGKPINVDSRDVAVLKSQRRPKGSCCGGTGETRIFIEPHEL